MASIAVQQFGGHTTSFEPIATPVQKTASKSKDVQSFLNYYDGPKDGSEPPAAYVGKPETYKLPTTALSLTVHDIRGREGEYTLDGNGFKIYHHSSNEKEFVDDDKIKAKYYPEVEQLLKDATGASRVFIFDHTIRRPAPPDSPSSLQRGPVNQVHVDQSYAAARNRVPHHLPDDAERLLKSRYQIINVWRPIKTILKDPLGVAEAHSVPESDLQVRALVYPDRRGETLAVRPNSAHQWFYLHGQTPEEVLLIKCFDSKLDGRARRVPHSAFENPAYKDEYARESIEVRCLVFHEDEEAE